MSSASLFMRVKDAIAKSYGSKPGRMLIHTGVISWLLSSCAQIAAIAINDKIPKEQKMFLIPQEMADAAVNILSFYTITQSLATVSNQLVKTGKWLPKTVRDFLTAQKFPNIGKVGTNVLKDAKLPEELLKTCSKFLNGVDVVATTLGSIISCNIVTPIIRNRIAANRQKALLERMNSNKENSVSNINTEKKPYMPRPTMLDFQSRNRVYPNSGSLKI